jgi:hypothetical protein
VLDKIVGGVGLRRGRRDPDHLIEGDALDFWRVEALDRGTLLRLRAEMKMPGLAWLEWALEPVAGGGTKVTQRAIYAPRGLLGHAYWSGGLANAWFGFSVNGQKRCAGQTLGFSPNRLTQQHFKFASF